MRTRNMKGTSRLGAALMVLLAGSGLARAQWTPLADPFPGHPINCHLLTDGTVMCQEYQSASWHRLFPDINGSYANGLWDNPSGILTMPNGTDNSGPGGTAYTGPYTPRYYASQVLADGRVVVIGGEYNSNGNTWTNMGFMYDPTTDSWSSQLTEPFGTGNIGDAQSVLLQNGTMLIANISNTNMASFNPSTLTFTALNPTGKNDRHDEEGWNILPDGTILTVDAGINNTYEIYNPTTNSWSVSGPTPVNLTELGTNCNSSEVGPAVLRPDGTLIYFTGNTAGQNAVYDTNTGNWSHTAGMDFPSLAGLQYGAADAPASLLPDGRVLVAGSPVVCNLVNPGPPAKYSIFNSPTHFFEWDGTNLTQVADPPGAGSLISYQGNMLLLPTGDVLFTGFDQGSTDIVQLYNNGGGPQDSWRPVITSGPHVVDPGHSYTISGKLFNGFSEGASYGDDAQTSTNYPLVRIRNRATGHVFYARTHDHSRMGVEAVGSTEIVSTQMDTPTGMETGLADLYVVVNGIPSKALVVNGPTITLPGPLYLSTCAGSSVTGTANVCNTGREDLTINSITSSEPTITVTTPSSGFPVNISPDFCFPFQVKYSPTQGGANDALLSISSSDPNTPSATLEVHGTAGVPDIDTQIADSGSYGEVCRGAFKDLGLTVHNSGNCPLSVSNITSSSADFQLASTLLYPVVVGPGGSLVVQIRFAPTTLGAKAGTITVLSNDPDTPARGVAVSGSVPSGDVRVTGSTGFGEVCGGAQPEKTVSVCNVGRCDLAVTSVAFDPACADFTLVNNPFPAPVSHDSCLGIVVRFTPTSCGAKTCTLKVMTDDPDTPVISLTATASTPCGSIDVPPDLGFPPTVISSVGACSTPEPFPVSNTGTCPLSITGFAITTDTAEYSLAGLPSFPIILQAGHEAGEGDLTVDFAPDILGRARAGTVKVTYVSDPITGATADVTRALCGEGVRTGARVLVTAGGNPMATVEQIKLQRINANRNKSPLDSIDTAKNLALQTVVPPLPCGPFQYHREYGTVSNPVQLLPGSYQVTVTAIVNGHHVKKSVGFDVTTCGFNPTIVVDF